MEFPDLKIEWIAQWFARFWERVDNGGEIVGGITQIDVQAYLIIIGVFMISWNWRWWGKKMDKVTDRLESFNKNIDNHTNALIENTRAIRKNNFLLESQNNANHRQF